jgi:hypothetical protein
MSNFKRVGSYVLLGIAMMAANVTCAAATTGVIYLPLH